jgi:hypothetical protein
MNSICGWREPFGKQLACAAAVEEPPACHGTRPASCRTCSDPRISGFLLRIAPAAAAAAHDEQNGDEAKGNECGNDDVHDCAW